MAETDPLRRLQQVDGLRDPVLIAAFVRKNGVNSTAAAALRHRIQMHSLEAIAELDAQPFFDFTQSRPQVRLTGGARSIDWPENRIYLERGSEGARDALVISGIEPHLHWRGFSEALLEFIAAQGVRSALIVRSFPAIVPHTRPALLRLTTGSAQLAEALGLPALDPSYEGPIDFGEVLASAVAADGGASGGVTALVPNYLGVVPNPMAVLELTRVLDQLLGTHTGPGDFERMAARVRAQADEQVARSPEVRDAVHEMEEQYEAMAALGHSDTGASDLPSADDLLGDVERFLASDGDDPPAPTP
ncbi:MAG: PAC2 family protein [Chloroflexi bacterium]|nr:PAC2 family protein [Chloroflexota bacterium]